MECPICEGMCCGQSDIAAAVADAITLADVEAQIAWHQQAIAKLRSTGIRLAAEAGVSGQDARQWLVSRGATNEQATALMGEVIRERRAARAGDPR